jgi:hypothetical protein
VTSFDVWSHPFRLLQNLLRARYGVLWNARLAARMGRPYCDKPADGLCPLCGGEDGNTHILAGCTHPDMKALYIHRHNEAGRVLLKHVRRGGLGGAFIVADVGAPGLVAGYGVTHTRVPAALLGGEQPASRPDMVIFDLPRPAAERHVRRRERCPPGTKVYIVEIGYRDDHDQDGKASLKRQQHQGLERQLRAAGYDVRYQVWDIGHTGVINQRARQQAAALGAARAETVMRDLQHSTVQCLGAVVQARRALERRRGLQETRPP